MTSDRPQSQLMPAASSDMRSHSDSESQYSQDDGTVIIERPIDNGDGQMSDEFPFSPSHPELAYFHSSVEATHVGLDPPILRSIDAVLWPSSTAANSVSIDGGPIGFAGSRRRAHASQGRFTPWVGSTGGARAWSRADEIEAATPSSQQIWAATRLRRYLIGICCALYLAATVLLIVVCSSVLLFHTRLRHH